MTSSSPDNPTAGSASKIVFCITELDPGGAERALVELVTRLDPSRFSPVVYCLSGRPRGNPTSLADRLEAAEVPVRFFGAASVIALPRVAKEVTRQLAADAPQIVQTFLFHANVLGAWAARRAGVPHVVTGIRVAERDAWWHRPLSRWADRFVDCHVCVSQSVLEFSTTHTGLPREKLLAIPNAVDVERFASASPIDRRALGVAADAQLITCVGRLDRQKGIDWLLESLRHVAAEVPKAELVLVGDGPERARLEELARRVCPLPVHFLGFRHDTAEILAASAVVVLSSRWEGMPNVVLEAMASGRAVVATDVEGVREALGPASDKQVVAVDDPRGFAEQIAAILTDPALRKKLQTANQERAREQFSFDATVGAYERLYSDLLAASR